MTIENEHGTFYVYCDGTCNESENFLGYEFIEVINRIKELGWVIRKEGENWCHYCSQCK